jgi:hypothetical protein
MPDGVTIIDKLDSPSMGESSFKGRLPPLGGSPVTVLLSAPALVFVSSAISSAIVSKNWQRVYPHHHPIKSALA